MKGTTAGRIAAGTLLAVSLTLSLGAANNAAPAAPPGRAVTVLTARVDAPGIRVAPRDVIVPRVTAHVTDEVQLTVYRTIPRWRAYLDALSQHGCWYVWGGAGPCGNGYDCSGLVVWAYAHVGIYLPHNTYQMLSSGRLRRIPRSQAKPGDLVFMYGGGHVEFVTDWWRYNAFGAHKQGKPVSFDNWSNVYGFYHVIGSG